MTSPLRSLSARGVSLLETLMVIFVLSVIVFLFANIFLGGSSLFSQRTAVHDIQRENIAAISAMDRVVRQGRAIVNYPEANPTESSSATTLIVKVPSIDALKEIIPATYDYFLYRRNVGQPAALEVQTIASGPGRISGTHVLSTAVKNLVFNYNADVPTSATRVTVTLETAKQIGDREVTFASETSLSLRND